LQIGVKLVKLVSKWLLNIHTISKGDNFDISANKGGNFDKGA